LFITSFAGCNRPFSPYIYSLQIIVDILVHVLQLSIKVSGTN
jgi:hypothetical protein